MPIRAVSLLSLALFLWVPPARAEPGDLSLPERFDYRWTLAGFKGVVARLFVPGRGEGRLTTAVVSEDGSPDLVETELSIWSPDSVREAFWRYGAEVDAAEKRTVRAWSSQRFRGKSREKEREAGEIDALDLASSIYFLRKERPELPSEETIWSSGRLNPVVIRPGPRAAAVWQGREVTTRSYSIRGVSEPGKPLWEGQMDLVLTDDERAIPLEIVVTRNGLRIRLELVDAVE